MRYFVTSMITLTSTIASYFWYIDQHYFYLGADTDTDTDTYVVFCLSEWAGS